MAGRRPGDSETVYASTNKAEKELNWKYVALTLPKHKAFLVFSLYFHVLPLFTVFFHESFSEPNPFSVEKELNVL